VPPSPELGGSAQPVVPRSSATPRRGVFEGLRLLAVAVGFLTRVPVTPVTIGPDDLRRASALFPLVGLGVAGVGVAARAAVAPLWGAGVATVAAIVAVVLVTGAFHEDGLADTADGLWGGWTPAERLAIMRDSRIGTYGTVALIAAFSLRLALLLPLGLADFARALVCAHVLARASSLLLAHLLPAAGAASSAGQLHARDEEGRQAPAHAAPSGDQPPRVDALPDSDNVEPESRLRSRAPARPRLGVSVVGSLGAWGIACAGVVVLATVGVAMRWWAPLPLGAGLVVCLGCVRLFRRRLGGISGDALGAANQLVELASMAAVVALVRAGLL
jgi:adenosylcobinamide-GDP ribazoletransferase